MAGAFTLKELATSTQTIAQGNPAKEIHSVASIEEATSTDISFIRDRKYAHHLESTEAGALILTPELAESYAGDCLVSTNPYLSYARVVTLMNPMHRPASGIDPSAVISDDATIDADVYIGAQVVIESGCRIESGTVIGPGSVIGRNSRIGKDNYLHPNVTFAADTVIGQRGIFHSGVMLGADGFGFVPDGAGWYKIPQIGCVVIGDDVEIGANTCIDRGTIGETRIGNGVKLDNLIHIAHNVQIGDHTVIAAASGVAGSAVIGKRCQISGMCSIAGHLTIADGTTITATGLVLNSIKKAGVYSSGTTIEEHTLWRKNSVRFRQLDRLSRKVTALEKQLAAQQKD